jgi:hypothetical protein
VPCGQCGPGAAKQGSLRPVLATGSAESAWLRVRSRDEDVAGAVDLDAVNGVLAGAEVMSTKTFDSDTRPPPSMRYRIGTFRDSSQLPTYRRLWVLSAVGTHLGTIITPRHVHNMAWGDDGKSLYLTARDRLYWMRLQTGLRLVNPT